ncbi:MAG: hypothetical protein JWM14_869 [Chitinophagaceae bacterium]|nr:hypothetical protein [Chitinophagaceae bacterium]
MKTKPLFLLLGLTIFFNPLKAQTFKQQYTALSSKKDTDAQLQFLKKWEKEDSKDAELYVAYFNYYVDKSRSEILTLGNDPKGDDVLEIMDDDSSKKEPVGYIYGDVHYEPKNFQKGISYITKGITLHPKRLDMRWGKVYMYGEVADYENFTKEIIAAIDYSDVIKNQWLWTDNKAVEDGKDRMLGAIQNYQVQLYNTGKDELLNNMRRIAEAVLKYYPDHIESLSNLSISYLLTKEYDKALIPLLKAEKLAPKDYIVLGNIAYAYKMKGDTKNAIKYYELTSKYGDDQAKQDAEKELKALKGK